MTGANSKYQICLNREKINTNVDNRICKLLHAHTLKIGISKSSIIVLRFEECDNLTKIKFTLAIVSNHLKSLSGGITNL